MEEYERLLCDAAARHHWDERQKSVVVQRYINQVHVAIAGNAEAGAALRFFESFLEDEAARMAKTADSGSIVRKEDLIRSLYDLAYVQTESLEEQYIGADLAYLFGAILKDDKCEWPADRPLVMLLQKWRSSPLDPVWQYVTVTPCEEPDPVEQVEKLRNALLNVLNAMLPGPQRITSLLSVEDINDDGDPRDGDLVRMRDLPGKEAGEILKLWRQYIRSALRTV